MRVWFQLLLGLVLSTSGYTQVKKIVFVCEHGSAKSVIAASYFNKIAKEKNLSWEAVPRGTDPDDEISPKTKKLLASDNMSASVAKPQLLAQKDVDDASEVILFYPLPETIKVRSKPKDWLDVNATNDDFQILRDNIVARILPLIDSLEQK